MPPSIVLREENSNGGVSAASGVPGVCTDARSVDVEPDVGVVDWEC